MRNLVSRRMMLDSRNMKREVGPSFFSAGCLFRRPIVDGGVAETTAPEADVIIPEATPEATPKTGPVAAAAVMFEAEGAEAMVAVVWPAPFSSLMTS